MMTANGSPRNWLTGLSARLLLLTVLFVMIAEVLIYVPSIARFRRTYLEDQIAKAHLAVLALEATAEASISDQLEMDLLYLSGALAIVLKEPYRRVLMLGDDTPKTIDLTIELPKQNALSWIGGAFGTLTVQEGRVLRVVGLSPRTPLAEIEVLIHEAPLKREMLAYSWRIVTLSVVISVITASLLYVGLLSLIVRPMRRLTESIIRFRRHPEIEPDDAGGSRRPARGDEIGIAETAFREMQEEVRAALRQKNRLAMLGGAVARINHDLRNALTSAVLASDRLSAIADPEVQRLAPSLYAAIDRAAGLCARTLDYVHDDRPPLRRTRFALDDLVAEAAAEGEAAGNASGRMAVQARTAVILHGDRAQTYRIFSNLIRNAARAGGAHLTVTATVSHEWVMIRITDDGPGIPPKLRERLFQPFATTYPGEGSGLGLAIARELAEAHGARLSLTRTGSDGTEFCLEWPRSNTLVAEGA